jgi:hypothetical protein
MTFLRLAFLAALLALTSLFVSLAVNVSPATGSNMEPRVKCQAVGVCPPPPEPTPTPVIQTSSTSLTRETPATPVVVTPRTVG